MPWRRLLFAAPLALLFALPAPAAFAQNASPHAIDIPKWFTETFLDFREDVADRFQDHRIRNLIVSDIMSTPLISVPPETLAVDLVETMLSRGISAVPVVENGRVLGAVSRQSLVKAL